MGSYSNSVFIFLRNFIRNSRTKRRRRRAGALGAGAAERSYPASEVRGGDPEKPPRARGSSWEEPPMPEARASGATQGAVAAQHRRA